jgi:hypothetical protein
MVFYSPLMFMFLEIREQWPRKIDQRLRYNRTLLPLPKFQIHHRDKGIPTSYPLFWLLVKLPNTRHQPSSSMRNKNRSIVAQPVTIITIEIGWECAPALIAEVVGLGRKFGGFFLVFEFVLEHLDD